MTIREELDEELKGAMRAKDKARMNVVRQIRTEASNRVAEPGFSGEPDDDFYRAVIGSYVKKMEKAREEYEELGERGAEMADQLAFEVEYLSRWLPQMLGEEQTRRLVGQAIDDLGSEDPKMAGRVIGSLMKEHGDQLDGALVNRLVREALAGD